MLDVFDLNHKNIMRYNPYIKRLIDLIISFSLLVVMSPLLIVITIILFFVNNGSPFFLQERPGKHGKTFKIIKFKTMRDLKKNEKSEKEVHSLSRITKAGQIIRKYSLDELLQLVNVFKGDMSLAGPRPLLIQYLPLYNEIQSKRHNVKPGITGWAQINGRNTISWDKKFEYDVWYSDNISLLLDIKIGFLTLKKVFFKEDINTDEHITMEVWKGNIN